MPDDVISATDGPISLPHARGKRSTLRFYGDEFVFDTVSGMFFRLSPSAAFILRRLLSGTELRDLPETLEARYGIDRGTAMRDVELFLNELAALEPLDRFTHDDRPKP